MPARRITGIIIHKLFEQYDYSIPLNKIDRITILHGPNGCGKTTLFELINALFSRDMTAIRRVLFNSLTVAFDDSSAISVYSSFPALAEANIKDPWIEKARKGEIDWRGGLSLYFALHDRDGSPSHVFELAPARFTDLLNPCPHNDLFGVFMWDFDHIFGDKDPRSDEDDPRYTIEERRNRIKSIYEKILDDPYDHPDIGLPIRFRAFPKELHFDGFYLPDPLCQALDGATIIYLGADRLSGSHPKGIGESQSGDLKVIALLNRVVDEKHRLRAEIIEKMRKVFDTSFTEHHRLRMMRKESDIPSLAELQTQWDEYVEWITIHDHWTDPDDMEKVHDDIYAEYSAQWDYDDEEEEERKDDNDYPPDIFGNRHTISFSRYQDNLNNRVALTLLFEYYDEVRRLISPFSEKVLLFRKILRYFFGKDLRGRQLFAWSDDEDQDRWVIPTSHLSSGEQHLTLLFGTMLFEAPENSLVLIDEPELSLHVHWQRQFLRIVEKIIAENPIDVLIATHSPQIVHDRRDLTLSLGPVE